MTSTRSTFARRPLHHEIAIRAAEAGKHIIMEKPLTGYFGEPGDREPIGRHAPRARMRAVDCVNVIYSAYHSAEEGRTVTLD